MLGYELTTIRPVRYAEILSAPNRADLFDEYEAECSLPELGGIAPQPNLYEAMEHSGAMECFGVFHNDSLVGFAAVLIYVLPHYGKKIATTESIFLAREHRKRAIGLRMMEFLEKHARAHGCMAFLYTAPVGSRFWQLLTVHRKYRMTNGVFLRKLV